ncbi:uncharacterized protein B0P05DRAFT_537498 [Gilbertella persicaria]|uniref:uncharacterized protein n=1 Tax=Gilbertella persicaria TaxID=101096 RepID=UPI00221F1260|nr:uncharacterized protein B0P05DRAFT_537498 [Gilbertella persicaria]KAI8082554.1 hypothetical protein B0P05DRAFT_537498 [Gilbertella persicaria]
MNNDVYFFYCLEDYAAFIFVFKSLRGLLKATIYFCFFFTFFFKIYCWLKTISLPGSTLIWSVSSMINKARLIKWYRAFKPFSSDSGSL